MRSTLCKAFYGSCYTVGITSDAVNHDGRHRIQIMEPAKKESRHVGDDPFVMNRPPFFKNWQVYPGKISVQSRTPNDIPDVQNFAILQQRQAGFCADHTRQTCYAGSSEIARQYTNERATFVQR